MPRSQRPITSTGARTVQTLGLAALLPLLAGGVLAACGGSSSPSATNAAATEQANEQKAETRFADFARCLREHGVNAEAVSHSGGGHGLKISPGSAGDGPAAMEGAEKACARYRPEQQKVNLSPQQKVEREEAVQKFAKCMREHGIKVETSATGGGVHITAHGGPGSGAPNPESPAFQAAQNACQKLLPQGGKRAGGSQVAAKP
jgi:diaminopimelate decarboxylase